MAVYVYVLGIMNTVPDLSQFAEFRMSRSIRQGYCKCAESIVRLLMMPLRKTNCIYGYTVKNLLVYLAPTKISPEWGGLKPRHKVGNLWTPRYIDDTIL